MKKEMRKQEAECRVVKIIALVAIVAAMIFPSCSGANARKGSHHHTFPILQRHGLLKKGINRVNPTEINLLALNLLNKIKKPNKQNGYDKTYHNVIKECQLYIQWYLNHLNNSDQYGLTGTIFNYQIFPNGKEKVIKNGADLDIQAATFILLLHRFQRITGYRQMIAQNEQKIANIAYLIPYLQDEKDDLVQTFPTSDQKLLVNNCLSYAALDSFIQLSTEFDWGKEDYYRGVRNDLKDAILTHMYRKNRGEFFHKIEKSDKPGHRKKHLVDWDNFFPGIYAQLFPIYLRIWPENDPEGRKQLWEKIRDLYHQKMKKTPVLQRIIYKWTAITIGDQDAYYEVKDGTRYMEKKNEKED
jgi:hypothetical protein